MKTDECNIEVAVIKLFTLASLSLQLKQLTNGYFNDITLVSGSDETNILIHTSTNNENLAHFDLIHLAKKTYKTFSIKGDRVIRSKYKTDI